MQAGLQGVPIWAGTELSVASTLAGNTLDRLSGRNTSPWARAASTGLAMEGLIVPEMAIAANQRGDQSRMGLLVYCCH